jgi:hypothetical protein
VHEQLGEPLGDLRPQRAGPDLRLVRDGERRDPGGVDGLDADLGLRSKGLGLSGVDEVGKPVGDRHRRARRELVQDAARSLFCLEEKTVADPAGLRVARVVSDPLEDELVKPIARVGIVATQTFVDDERQTELVGPPLRVREGEVRT